MNSEQFDWTIFETLLQKDSSPQEKEPCCCNPNCYATIENNTIIDKVTGDLICEACGTINSTVIDNKQEWNTYDNDNSSKERCGQPINNLLSEKSQNTTMISNTKFKKCSPNLQRFHNFDQSYYKDRVLVKTYQMIDNICNNLDIQSSIAHKAKWLYQMCYSFKINRGNVKTGVICACIYLSCKYNNTSNITFSKLANQTNINRKHVNNGVKIVEKIMWDSPTYKELVINSDNHYNDFMGYIFNISASINIKGKDLIKLTTFSKKVEQIPQFYEMKTNQLASSTICIFTETQLPELYNNGKLKNTICIYIDISLPTLTKKINELKELTK